MLIEVFADFSCPWCFIGRRRLARAQQMRPQLSIQTVWQPFQLNPEIPREGVDRRQRLLGKFGDFDRLGAMERVLEESGGKDGIRFKFDLIQRIPNTMAAHRLMRLAARNEKDEMLADRLFSGFFERGEDIGSPSILAAIAAEIGLDPAAAATFLASDEETETVASIDALGHQSGISGVPYFIFERRYALAGAQEPASFLPLFDALLASEDQLTASSMI
ncbi:MAG TPA: DsbA family oxidoreductase [Alphaproteobacteria bacterium]|nr:DsbA family oxidoreductase [Alphaproteobacteria bacterium]